MGLYDVIGAVIRLGDTLQKPPAAQGRFPGVAAALAFLPRGVVACRERGGIGGLGVRRADRRTIPS